MHREEQAEAAERGTRAGRLHGARNWTLLSPSLPLRWLLASSVQQPAKRKELARPQATKKEGSQSCAQAQPTDFSSLQDRFVSREDTSGCWLLTISGNYQKAIRKQRSSKLKARSSQRNHKMSGKPSRVLSLSVHRATRNEHELANVRMRLECALDTSWQRRPFRQRESGQCKQPLQGAAREASSRKKTVLLCYLSIYMMGILWLECHGIRAKFVLPSTTQPTGDRRQARSFHFFSFGHGSPRTARARLHSHGKYALLLASLLLLQSVSPWLSDTGAAGFGCRCWRSTCGCKQRPDRNG